MIKWVIGAALAAQAAGAPDLHQNADYGFSFQKPAGKAEWAFATAGGKLRSSRIVVKHQTDDITFEIAVQLPVSDSYDPRKAAESEHVDQVASDANKEVRKRKLEDTTLPGRAASGVRVWHLDMLLRDKDDKFTEWRLWCLVGRENRCLYKVGVVCPQGLYEKHRKDVEAMLGSLRTTKLPRK